MREITTHFNPDWPDGPVPCPRCQKLARPMLPGEWWCIDHGSFDWPPLPQLEYEKRRNDVGEHMKKRLTPRDYAILEGEQWAFEGESPARRALRDALSAVPAARGGVVRSLGGGGRSSQERTSSDPSTSSATPTSLTTRINRPGRQSQPPAS